MVSDLLLCSHAKNCRVTDAFLFLCFSAGDNVLNLLLDEPKKIGMYYVNTHDN
jgi:hypothetical protein